MRARLVRLFPLLLAVLLTACGTTARRDAPAPAPDDSARTRAPAARPATTVPALPPANSGRGGYYQDDGPPDKVPDNLHLIPDAEPKIEPVSRAASKPYAVLGKTYTPITGEEPFKQRGVGTWYGRKFHGQRTASGEIYDMFKMTAAHPTLPIPSYARVTNLSNGAQVIVRINDRGPFHSSRIIDLSYTAALKLGYLGNGSGQLEVERILPAEIAAMRKDPQGLPAQPPLPVQVAAQVEARESRESRDTRDAAQRAAGPSSTPRAIVLDGVAAARPLEPLASAASPAPAAAPPLAPAASEPQDPIRDLIEKSAAAVDAEHVPGIYLQFGAFAQLGNAEAQLTRLMQGWAEGLPPLDIVAQGKLFRIFAGPFADRAAAQAATARLPAGVAKPVIVQR